MTKYILITALCLLNIVNSNTAGADSIFECGGVIQNRPCAAKQNGRELTNLPPISRYSSAETIQTNDAENMRARPSTETFDVPNTDNAIRLDEQALNKSAVQGKTAEDLISRSSQLKTGFATGTISLPTAEAESIRLRVLHDTLCTKQTSSYDPRWDESCRKSGENIQAASTAIRDAKTRS